MLRVLVVEDDSDVRAAICDALRDAGHEVTGLGDGQQGLEHILSKTFDLVVTDVRLPKLGGLALFHKIREVAPSAMLSCA